MASVATLLALAGCGSDDHADQPQATPASRRRDHDGRCGRPAAQDLVVVGREAPLLGRGDENAGCAGSWSVAGPPSSAARPSTGSHWVVVRGDSELAPLAHGTGAQSPGGLGERAVRRLDDLRPTRSATAACEADTSFTVTAYDVGRGRVTGTTVLESHTELLRRWRRDRCRRRRQRRVRGDRAVRGPRLDLAAGASTDPARGPRATALTSPATTSGRAGSAGPRRGTAVARPSSPACPPPVS